MVWNIGKTLIYLERRILYLTHTSSMSLEMRGCGEDRQLQPWALFSSLPWGETLYVQHSILFLWYKQSASEWAGYVNKSSDWIQRGGLILDRGFLWGLSRDIWHDWSEESLVETELTLFHWNCAAFFHIIGALKPLCAEQLQDEKLSEHYFFANEKREKKVPSWMVRGQQQREEKKSFVNRTIKTLSQPRGCTDRKGVKRTREQGRVSKYPHIGSLVCSFYTDEM